MTTTEGEAWTHPTGRWPKVVDLVALGESTRSDYLNMRLTKGELGVVPAEETWAVNRGLRVFVSDLAFVLDEIDSEAHKDRAYGGGLRQYLASGRPIITTRITRSWHVRGWNLRTFPARLVLACFGMDPQRDDPYWHNSIPMILAYACAIGVKELRLWGADYTLPGGQVLEDDRACCEHWIGRCMQRGMSVALSPSSTLCNRRQTRGQPYVYGLLNQEPDQLRAFLGQGPAHLPLHVQGKQLDEQSSIERIANLTSHTFEQGGHYCLACGIHKADAGTWSCETYAERHKGAT